MNNKLVEPDLNNDKEWLVYLQGGPGFGCSNTPQNVSWIEPAIDKHYQVSDSQGSLEISFVSTHVFIPVVTSNV